MCHLLLCSPCFVPGCSSTSNAYPGMLFLQQMEKKYLQNIGFVEASTQNWCILSHFSGKNKLSGQVRWQSGIDRVVLSLGGMHLTPGGAHWNSEIPLEPTGRISSLEVGDIPCLDCGSFSLLSSISLYGYTTIYDFTRW